MGFFIVESSVAVEDSFEPWNGIFVPHCVNVLGQLAHSRRRLEVGLIFLINTRNHRINLFFRWWTAYRDAVSFRSSHYFVSFASEASAIMSGYGLQEDLTWNLPVSRPHHIEIPRSLVQVVVYWSMPMHTFLKQCKYHNFTKIHYVNIKQSVLSKSN